MFHFFQFLRHSRRGTAAALFVALLTLTYADSFAQTQSQLKKEVERPEGEIVVLRALDKVTARTQDLSVPIGETVIYGSIAIRPRKCLKRPPEETPETSTFLEITEIHDGEEGPRLFNGWMFASSPGINALEHPVYDVWVIDCKMSEPESPSGKE
ncbi:DUF2155 domain-containing protein [uncultured Sneathiella sp.]|uniref:DUF2155 domain-containing protein n=1 Tax=uncultured Sneathiella sp. TaxID=879315 RepID=UPI0030DB7881